MIYSEMRKEIIEIHTFWHRGEREKKPVHPGHRNRLNDKKQKTNVCQSMFNSTHCKTEINGDNDTRAETNKENIKKNEMNSLLKNSETLIQKSAI